MITWLAAIIFPFSLPDFIYGREIHVSKAGRDKEGCASINNPCLTIHYAFYNASSSNDIIKVDGSGPKFTIKHRIRILKPTNITFTSYNGVAWIYGNDPSWRVFYRKQFLVVENYESLWEETLITFKKINFRDTALAKLGDLHALPTINIKVRFNVIHCLFRFSSTRAERSYKGAQWYTQTIISISMPSTYIKIANCVIQANHQAGIIRYPGREGCINLSSTKIQFTDTRIENARYSLHSWSPSCTNMFRKESFKFTMLRCVVKSKGGSQSRTAQVAIAIGKLKRMKWLYARIKYSRFENLSVLGKTAAVIDIRALVNIVLKNCTFKRNIGNRGGALSFDSTTCLIENSIFDGNEARLSTICANKDEGGNGGAIFISGHGGARNLFVSRSSFVNNVAFCFGSAAYFGHLNKLSVEQTSFKAPAAKRLSSPTLWFSYSYKLSIDSAAFEVRGQRRIDETIFFARYKRIHLKGKRLTFKCPTGSAVNISSNHGNTTGGTNKEVKCSYCPKNTYTLRPSYVSGINDTGKLYPTMQCQSCSFGADCNRWVKPKPNFWGYLYKNKAFMLICPPGYCCQSKSKCVALQSCNGMRTGRLCGKCKRGYFQSIFTSDCIEEKYCRTGKFWAIAVSCCILFTMLFIFLKDISRIIIKLLSIENILAIIKRKLSCRWATSSCMKKLQNEAETICDDNEQDNEIIQNEPVNNADGIVDQTIHAHLDDRRLKLDNNSMADGLIKIVFFFYQVHSILTIYKSNGQLKYLTKIKSIILSAFNLNVHIPFRSEVHCPFHEMSSTAKVLITASFPISCLVLACTLHGLTDALSPCFKKNEIIHKKARMAKPKLLVAILQLILLGYATLTSGALALVTCLPLANGRKILYIDGNEYCYQHWQYAILLFILCWALPLIYVIYRIPCYMRNGEISIRGFYVALLFPLPFSIFAMIRTPQKMKFDEGGETEPMVTPLITDVEKMRADAIVMWKLENVLVGPFRYNGSGEQREKLSWESVLLFQRILLSLCNTFILEPGTRSLILLLFVIILTAFNFMYRPFNRHFLNATNGAMFILLCITGIINAIYAFIYEYGTVPNGPLVRLLGYFDYVEVIMIVIFPIFIALAFIIIGILKLAGIFIAIIWSVKNNCKRTSQKCKTSSIHSHSG